MSKKVPLIIRQVKNVWQVLLPGGVLLQTFKNKREALSFNLTEEEKQNLLNGIKSYKENKQQVTSTPINDSLAVKAVKQDKLMLPEGLKEKVRFSSPQMQPRKKVHNEHISFKNNSKV